MEIGDRPIEGVLLDMDGVIADVSASDESKVPATSLLREFIGGGAYDIH